MLKSIICLLAVAALAPLAMADTLIVSGMAGLRDGANADTNYMPATGANTLCNFPVILYRIDLSSMIAATGSFANGPAVFSAQIQWTENLAWPYKVIATAADFDPATVTWNSYTGGAANMGYWDAMTPQDTQVFPAAGNFVAKANFAISQATLQSWIDNGGVATIALVRGADYFNTCHWANTSWNTGAYARLEATTIPEPATMALLGLGALALIRRRR